MRKILSLFVAALFAGSMMAQETPKVTLNFTTDGVQGLANPWGMSKTKTMDSKTYTKDGYSITFSKTTKSGSGHSALFSTKKVSETQTDTIWTGFVFGAGNNSGATVTLPAMTFDVSKIRVHFATTSGSTAVKHTIVAGTEAATLDTVIGCKVEADKGELSDGTGEYVTFNILTAKQAAGTVYAIKVVNDKNNQVSKVEFFEKVAGAPEEPVFSVAGGIYTSAQTLTLTCPTDGAEIFYTLDGTDPTDASTKYTEPISITETKTVKAVAVKNSLKSSVVSNTYKIITLVGNGTKDNPYTVADVKALENTRPDTAWVYGYILGAAKDKETIVDTVTTNLALGDSATQTTGFVPVELPTSFKVRETLNVKDNPNNKGKWVKVRGALVAYFSIPAVKGVKTFELQPDPSHDASISWLKVGDAALSADENKVFSLAAANNAPAELAVTFALAEGATADRASGFKIAVPEAGAAAVDSAIVVTAEDGTTKVTYHVSVTRKAADAPKSTDATIKELKINNTVVAEKEGVFAYEVAANENLAQVSVAFILNDANAVADKDNPFTLAVPASSEEAASEATINVTAEDGTTKKAYKVSVTRKPAEQGINDINATEKAVKLIENGQLVIIKNGVRYSVFGTVIK